MTWMRTSAAILEFFCLSAVYFATGMYTFYERLCYILWMKWPIFSSRGSEVLQIQTFACAFLAYLKSQQNFG